MVRSIACATPIRAMDYSPQRGLLALSSDDFAIKLYDVSGVGTGGASAVPRNILAPTKTLRGHTRLVRSLAFHPDPSAWTMFSVSDDRSVRAWDIREEGKCMACMSDHLGRVRALAIHPRVSRYSSISLLVLDSLRPVAHGCSIFHPPSIPFALLHQYIITGSDDHTIKLWSMSIGECTLTLSAHDHRLYSIVLDGDVMVSASHDKAFKVRHTDPRCAHSYRSHAPFVTSSVRSHSSNCGILSLHQRSGTFQSPYRSACSRAP